MAQLNEYDVGDAIRLTGRFRSLDDGQLTDPSAISLRVKPPTGTTVEYVYGTDAELVRDEAGVYHAIVTPNAAGDWVYRFIGLGTIQQQGERRFVVKPAVVDAG